MVQGIEATLSLYSFHFRFFETVTLIRSYPVARAKISSIVKALGEKIIYLPLVPESALSQGPSSSLVALQRTRAHAAALAMPIAPTRQGPPRCPCQHPHAGPRSSYAESGSATLPSAAATLKKKRAKGMLPRKLVAGHSSPSPFYTSPPF
jgi:hypothetical protein